MLVPKCAGVTDKAGPRIFQNFVLVTCLFSQKGIGIILSSFKNRLIDFLIMLHLW